MNKYDGVTGSALTAAGGGGLWIHNITEGLNLLLAVGNIGLMIGGAILIYYRIKAARLKKEPAVRPAE